MCAVCSTKVQVRFRKPVWLTAFLLLAHTAFPQGQARILQGALRPERTCFDVVYYDLHLKVVPKKHLISGYNEIFFKVIAPTQRIQLDLFSNLIIDSITFDNNKLAYERKFNAVFIDFPEMLPLQSIQSLRFFYHGSPQTHIGPHGDTGFHWDKDDNGKDLVGVSCEDVGASLWYPNKDHLSDEPDSARLHWTVPQELVCISNGRLESKDVPVSGFRTWNWFNRNPINNYNITFYLGNYMKLPVKLKQDTVTRTIECYFIKGKEEFARKYFPISGIMVDFCEKKFGPYAFWDDKFAIVQTHYRGMEHQTCINIGEGIAYDTSLPYDYVLIHEIAHEWWGNAVSASDMADMWLHEGFATYTEWLFEEALFGNEAYIKRVKRNEMFSNYAGRIIGKRNVYYNIFATNMIYTEGALFLHNLRKEIKNDEVFFSVLKTFQQRFRKKTVTTDDFLSITNEVTGKSFDAFFKKRL